MAGRLCALGSHPENHDVHCANLALNQVRNAMPVNAFVVQAADVDTGSAVWIPTAYVGTKWEPRFLALDDLALPACELI